MVEGDKKSFSSCIFIPENPKIYEKAFLILRCYKKYRNFPHNYGKKKLDL